MIPSIVISRHRNHNRDKCFFVVVWIAWNALAPSFKTRLALEAGLLVHRQRSLRPREALHDDGRAVSDHPLERDEVVGVRDERHVIQPSGMAKGGRGRHYLSATAIRGRWVGERPSHAEAASLPPSGRAPNLERARERGGVA